MNVLNLYPPRKFIHLELLCILRLEVEASTRGLQLPTSGCGICKIGAEFGPHLCRFVHSSRSASIVGDGNGARTKRGAVTKRSPRYYNSWTAPRQDRTCLRGSLLHFAGVTPADDFDVFLCCFDPFHISKLATLATEGG